MPYVCAGPLDLRSLMYQEMPASVLCETKSTTLDSNYTSEVDAS